MYDRMKFSERIKELRSLTGKTQKEFAKFVESTPATISAYENGTKNPSLDVVSTIAEKCEVSLDWLCGLEDNSLPRIKTYSDIIKFFFAIQKSNLNYYLSNSDDPNYRDPENLDCIVFNDINIRTFFEEWYKMASLYEKKTIDRDLFELWLEKTFNKYDVEIKKDTKK